MDIKDRNINILILEDSHDDIELMEEELRKHNFTFRSLSVESRDNFIYQLNHFHPDVILADYTLPTFNGLEALDIAQTQTPLVPFIFVTGTLEVERAVETILNGADNFILKDNLPSLPGAVYRAIEAGENHRKRIEAERALRQSKEHFYKLFHANPVPATVSKLESEKIIDVNIAFLEVTGYQHNEFVNDPLAFEILWQQSGDKNRLIQRLREHHTVRGYTASLITKTGDIRTCLISAELIQIDEEDHILAMYFDDTDRQRTIREIQEQSEALARSNSELERFAYITSHDLRAPVVNILELVALLDSQKPDPDLERQLIEKLRKSTQQLDSTLNTLIEVVALKNQTATDKQWIMWREVFDDVLLSINQQVQKSNTQLTVDFSRAPKVLANRDYLQSIILNLLTNAIRYKKPNHPPVIQITTYWEDDNTVLSILDEGIGIDLNRHRNKLFGLYQQFSSGKQGKGLGLYLVKNQLKRMDGHVTVNSRLGEYTEFKCFLPNKKI